MFAINSKIKKKHHRSIFKGLDKIEHCDSKLQNNVKLQTMFY